MEIGSGGRAVQTSEVHAQLGARKPSLLSPLTQARELAKSVCSMVRHQVGRITKLFNNSSHRFVNVPKIEAVNFNVSFVDVPEIKAAIQEDSDFEEYCHSIQKKFQKESKSKKFLNGDGQLSVTPVDFGGSIVLGRYSNYSRSLTSDSNFPVQGLNQKFSSLSPFELAALEQDQTDGESPSSYLTANSESLSPFSSEGSIDEFETLEDQDGSPKAQASPERPSPSNSTADLRKTQANQRDAFVALLIEDDASINPADFKSSPAALQKKPLSPIAEVDETNFVSPIRTGTSSERTAVQLHFVKKMKELEPTKQSLDDPSSKGVYGWGFKILGKIIQDQGLPWNPHEFVKAQPNPDYESRPPLNYVDRATQAIELKKPDFMAWRKRFFHK